MKGRPHILVCYQASNRRPLRHDVHRRQQQQPAFQYLAGAATAIAAAAALVAAVRAVLSERTRRAVTAGVLRTKRKVQHALHLNTIRVKQREQLTYANRLDNMASRVATKLEFDLTTPTTVPTDPVLYAKLPPKQRADLLLDAFRQAAIATKAVPPPVPAPAMAATPMNYASRENWESAMSFWRMAEGVNGRLAALGFAVCLLRESLEPTHPSMLAQMKDVLVPVAVHTPPFLVAVVDRMVDWLT